MKAKHPGHALGPDSRVRSALSGLLGPATMTRIVDPVLADYQKEASAPEVAGRLVRQHLLRLRWSVALLLALSLDFALGTSGVDEREYRRRLWLSSLVGCSVVVALTFGAAWKHAAAVAQRAHDPLLVPLLFAYLLPSALAVGIPCGLLLGSLSSKGHERASARPLFVTAAGAAVMLLCLLAFVVPSANMTYRVSVWRSFTETHSMTPLQKGAREMTFAELGATASAYERRSMPAEAAVYAAERQRRFALSAACLVFAWLGAAFAGSGVSRSVARRLGFVALVVLLYYGLFVWGTNLVTRLTIDSTGPVWIANATFAFAAGVTHFVRRQRARGPRLPA